jgi:hypothetical protein
VSTTVSKRAGIRVRGTCAEGHTTEATTEPGRVTNRGPCSHEGCALQVVRKRIPRETPEADAPATKATETGAEDGPGYKVREARIRRERPSKRAAERKPDTETEERPDDRVPPAGGAGTPPVRDDVTEREPDGDERRPRAGFRSRLRRGERPEREPRRHPLQGIAGWL